MGAVLLSQATQHPCAHLQSCFLQPLIAVPSAAAYRCLLDPAPGAAFVFSGREWDVPVEVFDSIETLLPTGKGLFLELWAPAAAGRAGWTHVVEQQADTPGLT